MEENFGYIASPSEIIQQLPMAIQPDNANEQGDFNNGPQEIGTQSRSHFKLQPESGGVQRITSISSVDELCVPSLGKRERIDDVHNDRLVKSPVNYKTSHPRTQKTYETVEQINLGPLMGTLVECMVSSGATNSSILKMLELDKIGRDSVLAGKLIGTWITPDEFDDHIISMIETLEKTSVSHSLYLQEVEKFEASYKSALLELCKPIVLRINKLWTEQSELWSKFGYTPNKIDIFSKNGEDITLLIKRTEGPNTMRFIYENKSPNASWCIEFDNPNATIEQLSEMDCSKLESYLHPHGSLLYRARNFKFVSLCIGEHCGGSSAFCEFSEIAKQFTEFTKTIYFDTLISPHAQAIGRALDYFDRSRHNDEFGQLILFHELVLWPMKNAFSGISKTANNRIASIRSQCASLRNMVLGGKEQSGITTTGYQDNECPVCLEQICEAARILDCGHAFCIRCSFACDQNSDGQGKCPQCRECIWEPFCVPVIPPSGPPNLGNSIDFLWGSRIEKLHEILTRSFGVSTLVLCGSDEFARLVSKFLCDFMLLNSVEVKCSNHYSVYSLHNDVIACATPTSFLRSPGTTRFQRVIILSQFEGNDNVTTVINAVTRTTQGRVEIVKVVCNLA